MKLYRTTITPISNFVTILKGDTLFGQMCWAIRFAYGNERLEVLLSNYETEPFLIVSDGFANGYLPKPTMPSKYLNEDTNLKKENRKKVWLTDEDFMSGRYENAKSDQEVGNAHIVESVIKNAINYKTSTTVSGFDPYGVEERTLSPQDIYFLISDAISIEELTESFKLVAEMGYGKKSTIGKGRFSFIRFEMVSYGIHNTTTYMTLCPSVLNGITCKTLFYEPFTRFGKSGASRANVNSFKSPVLLADSGAVLLFEAPTQIQYIGKSVTNISMYQDIVQQGYSIVIPMKELSYDQ